MLIDYPKAFDIVDNELLMAELQAYGKFANWFNSNLNGRLQFVSFRCTDSYCVNGVSQGSILGPSLLQHIQSNGVDLDLT